MSSMRKVFWRGGFALAMVPVALALVAASPAAPADPQAAWKIEFSKADMRERELEQETAAIALQLADGQADSIRSAVTIAIRRAGKPESSGKSDLNIRILRGTRLQPSG